MSIGRICRREVHLADPRETIHEAARRMAVRRVGSLVVVDDRRRPVGVLSDRDIVARVVAAGRDPDRCSVREVMSDKPVTAPESTAIEDVLQEMLSWGVRRILVTDRSGALAGIVAIDDVLELLGEELHTIGRVVGRQQPAREWT